MGHEIPEGIPIDPEGELWFITICCEERGRNSLGNPEVWNTMVEAMEYWEGSGQLKSRLTLAMPDHLHALWMFPGDRGMRQGVTAFKRWVARKTGIRWQRDFFDHRVRGWESAAEKAAYIRSNPVRAGLVERPEDWPYQR